MSFILEALKKSENKRRNEGSQNPPSIHEHASSHPRKSKLWMLAVLILLALSGTGLFWYVALRQPPVSVGSELILAPEPTRSQVSSLKPAAVMPLPSTVNVELPSTGFVEPEPQFVATPQPQLKFQPQVKTVAANSIPILRNAAKVYTLDQLPASVRNNIPIMKMRLHAYNRDDSSASLVQLNGQILREGDSVTAQIELQQITAEGIVLRYDGYRFQLLRRMN